MSEVDTGDDYEYSVEEALEELRLSAGINSTDAAPANPDAAGSNVLSGLSPELKLLSEFYFKGVVSFEEVIAPDRIATINQIRKEGRI